MSKFGKWLAACLAVCMGWLLLAGAMPAALAVTTPDALSASGCTYPTTLKEGDSFGLRGVISSAISQIVQLEAGVYDSAGKLLTGRSWNPKAKSVDLRWYVDSHVKFGSLAAGTYTYKVTATNGSWKETLVEQPFVVTAKAKATDKLTVTGPTAPTTLVKGKGFALKGVVSSQSSNLTKLTAGAFNAKGEMVTGRSWNPKAKSVDFRWFVDPYVKFGSLDVGTYTYRIIAANAGGEQTLVNTEFTVTAPDPVSISDKLTATGCNAPTSIVKGKGFGVRGVVSSQSSNLSKLTVGAFNAKGEMVTGRSWNPKAKSIDLRWFVDPYIKFGSLGAGTYTYKIVATNIAGEQTLLSQEFTVTAPTPATDKLTASGCTAPTSITKGKGFGLRGVVFSQSSNLTKLTAGVFDGSGKMLTGRSWNPKAKSVDLRWFVDPYVKFGTLAAGTYTYKIVAANAAGEQTLLSQDFTVTPAAPATDNLSGTGLNAPELLIKGKGFGLKGRVSSQISNISNLTAGVFDGSGKMLTGRSWNPKAKSIDLRWYVDEHVKFGSLAVGSYTYKVIATNASGTATLLEKTFEVTD